MKNIEITSYITDISSYVWKYDPSIYGYDFKSRFLFFMLRDSLIK